MEEKKENHFLIGTAKADITPGITGVGMLGWAEDWNVAAGQSGLGEC
jgi:hypothetical protein